MEQNLFYGTGILATFDKYVDNKKTVSAKYPKKKSKPEETATKSVNPQISEDIVSLLFTLRQASKFL